MWSTRRAFLRDSGSPLVQLSWVELRSPCSLHIPRARLAAHITAIETEAHSRFRSDYGALEPKPDQAGQYVRGRRE
jgi:hypothetical protein